MKQIDPNHFHEKMKKLFCPVYFFNLLELLASSPTAILSIFLWADDALLILYKV